MVISQLLYSNLTHVMESTLAAKLKLNENRMTLIGIVVRSRRDLDVELFNHVSGVIGTHDPHRCFSTYAAVQLSSSLEAT